VAIKRKRTKAIKGGPPKKCKRGGSKYAVVEKGEPSPRPLKRGTVDRHMEAVGRTAVGEGFSCDKNTLYLHSEKKRNWEQGLSQHNRQDTNEG